MEELFLQVHNLNIFIWPKEGEEERGGIEIFVGLKKKYPKTLNVYISPLFNSIPIYVIDLWLTG